MVTLDGSDIIAVIALAVASLSAWLSLKEARRGNRYGRVKDMIAISDEVISFSLCFQGLDAVPSSDRLQHFHQMAVRRASYFYSDDIAKQLQDIYRHCHTESIWLDMAESDAPTERDAENERLIREAYRDVRHAFSTVLVDMSDEIKRTLQS
ncbi:MAG: hypothetical protein AAF493_23225 [Pseudomonadota bacterium]